MKLDLSALTNIELKEYTALLEKVKEARKGCLTEIEKRVGLRILAGGSIEEIAEGLQLSIKTVRGHLMAIYGKYDVANRAQFTAQFVVVAPFWWCGGAK